MQFDLAKCAMTLALLTIAGLPQPAIACRMVAPFHLEDLKQADTVFTGKLVRYQRISPGRPDTLDDYGLLTVQVSKVFKGKVSGDVQLYWWNSTFGVPKTVDKPGTILIAAVAPDTKPLPLRGSSATVFGTRRPDLLQVMQAPCSSPFILSSSKSLEDNVRTILRGGVAAPYSPF